ncbi:MAG: hypothetical protein HY554_03950 [Elusimicrobia bacterium]|nr:hypothetical protein [Elusimicrobiota bacterium]
MKPILFAMSVAISLSGAAAFAGVEEDAGGSRDVFDRAGLSDAAGPSVQADGAMGALEAAARLKGVEAPQARGEASQATRGAVQGGREAGAGLSAIEQLSESRARQYRTAELASRDCWEEKRPWGATVRCTDHPKARRVTKFVADALLEVGAPVITVMGLAGIATLSLPLVGAAAAMTLAVVLSAAGLRSAFTRRDVGA